MESSRRRVPQLPPYGQFMGQPSTSQQGSHSGPSTPRRTEHSYTLTSSKNVAWAKLAVSSRARSSNHLPSFFEGEDITGSVDLSLEREESIKAVTVSV